MSAMAMMRTAGHKAVGGFDLAFAVILFRHQQLDRDPQQQQAADQLEEWKGHDLRDDGGKKDAQQHRHAGAEDHAPEPLTRLQHAAGQRDHHGVVAGKQHVDPDDLQRRKPIGRMRDFL